jgi:hypothetical protein
MLVDQVFNQGISVMMSRVSGRIILKGDFECSHVKVVLLKTGVLLPPRRQCSLDSDRAMHRPVYESTTICTWEMTNPDHYCTICAVDRAVKVVASR